MTTVSVRYIVDDVESAIKFYTTLLGFSIVMHPAPSFAMLAKGDLRLLMNGMTGPGGASQPMPDASPPQAAGTVSRSRLQILKTKSSACARPGPLFATISCRA
jgi:catechol 2,3-dioxygenase-like lactoylglutathione lyase family enzyme